MSHKYRIDLDENQSFEVVIDGDGKITFNGDAVELDSTKTGHGTWHVLHDNRSYNVKLIPPANDSSSSVAARKLTLSVNDEIFEMKINTELDDLLSKMGMHAGGSSRMGDVHAPMPGLVLKVLVKDGDEISEGDRLIILEAMKMENIIKATGKGTVAKVHVSNQDTVDKNQVLIEMC